MPQPESAVRAAFTEQAKACAGRGSPFTARLCEALAQVLDRDTAIGRRVLDWKGRPDARGDSLPLRLAGGLQALVRRGRLPRLAAIYPPAPLPEAASLAPLLADALREAEAELLPWLDRAPQTNEPMRAAPLMAGLLVVAAETGSLPLALHEIGASAGLLLQLDRYEHRLGQTIAGSPGAPVVLTPRWEGPSPPSVPLRVGGRYGTDLDPLDVTRAEDRERLLAYIWPDQPERVARVEAAMAITAREPPRIDRAEAAAWTETVLDPKPAKPGCVRVLMHAVALQYAPEETRQRVAAKAAQLGAQASDSAPFAWLRFEADAEFGEQGSLRLTLWPGGEERVLALGDTHGEALHWQG